MERHLETDCDSSKGKLECGEVSSKMDGGFGGPRFLVLDPFTCKVADRTAKDTLTPASTENKGRNFAAEVKVIKLLK